MPATTDVQERVTVLTAGELLNTSSCANWAGVEKVKLPLLVWKPANETALLVSTRENGAWTDGYVYHCPICQNTRPLLS